jgi:hypothetical protein
VRILYFGTYDRRHPRNTNAIAALRDAGIEVVERQRQLERGGVRGVVDVLDAELRLLTSRQVAADVVVVGYPGHFDVPQARRIARKRPLVFDAVLSLEHELVSVRRHFRPRSVAANVLRVADARAFRLPDLVVCGTEAEARHLRELGAERTAVVLQGADEDLFCETWAPAYPFSALHQVDASTETVQTAAALTSVPIRVVERAETASDSAGITFAHAGVVLGSFHESRGIAPSVFAALATGAPVITADTEAARELLRDGESALLVPPGDPRGLATAVDQIAGDEALRTSIAAGGRRAFELHATRAARGRKWRALLEDLLT